jgi:flavin-dependent dehydrogenase
MILSSAMHLLDEIGLDEADYAHDHAPSIGIALEFRDYFRAAIRLPEQYGRDYLYGLDREVFDDVLWKHLENYPTVSARQDFAVTDLVHDDKGKVIGITGHHPNADQETFTAKRVVGADGRFSLVARKAEAKIIEENTRFNTTVYYAYWEGCEPYDADGEWVHIYTGVDGFSCFIMPSAGNSFGVLAQCRQDYFDAPDGPEAWYMNLLQSYPRIWDRLKCADRVTEVSGMKNVGNLYREAFGDGWLLVGDAHHHKDSYDAQGIYDALFAAKLLANALIEWHNGENSWVEAMTAYQTAVYNETHPMFQATLDRLQREMYSEPPTVIIKTILRWLLTNPEYQRRIGLLVTRGIHPDKYAPPTVMLKAILSGIVGDIGRLITRRPNPNALPK